MPIWSGKLADGSTGVHLYYILWHHMAHQRDLSQNEWNAIAIAIKSFWVSLIQSPTHVHSNDYFVSLDFEPWSQSNTAQGKPQQNANV